MRHWAGLLGCLLGLAVGACDWAQTKEAQAPKTPRQLAAERDERIRKACASDATYEGLKELVFDEAARIRNADARNLDPIAAAAFVRMEEPRVKSRDEKLNVTVCTGRFVLDLPPGAENAFDGMRRVTADVEYAAQAAADGSGLVYQMDGAEPIIYRLASFGMNGQPAMPASAAFAQAGPPPPPPAPPPRSATTRSAPPAPPPTRAPSRPVPPPRPAPVAARASEPPSRIEPAPIVASRPSFNCRYAHTRSERLVCASSGLAGRDRAMASAYYGAVARADAGGKARLRASRDAFLARRERCGTEACVAAAYDRRIAELRGSSQ